MTQIVPSSYHQTPRLYVEEPLNGAPFAMSEHHSHYLRHVLRLQDQALVRVFHVKDGEWVGRLETIGKKGVVFHPLELLRAVPTIDRRIHLCFSPLKKDRMDFLIEKSVELGVSDLHPLLMRRSVVRDIKADRLRAQIIEASEQSERLNLAQLHDLVSLEKFMAGQVGGQQDSVFYAALERHDCASLKDVVVGEGAVTDVYFLIGPEGGFEDSEVLLLQNSSFVRAVSLGERILRAETAALFGLSHLV
ncbi:MAG TPA: RsmE family RNA methyltransferase [Alphaproteobacteria bacterium]|nr:16S rRNA (uracil(1498)-N(3))-methyltransferase [Alphaproteobacteria bacterium]HOO51965.1 RsmE family RNA methyltransferase [Alphaproteobacteria bacterium]